MSRRRGSYSLGSILFRGVGKDQLFPHWIGVLLKGFALDEINLASEQAFQFLFQVINESKMGHPPRCVRRKRDEQVDVAVRLGFAPGHGAKNFQSGDGVVVAEIFQFRFEPDQRGCCGKKRIHNYFGEIENELMAVLSSESLPGSPPRS